VSSLAGQTQQQQGQELAQQQAGNAGTCEAAQKRSLEGAIVVNPDGCTFSFAVREVCKQDCEGDEDGLGDVEQGMDATRVWDAAKGGPSSS
jgi:hypothetical protein